MQHITTYNSTNLYTSLKIDMEQCKATYSSTDNKTYDNISQNRIKQRIAKQQKIIQHTTKRNKQHKTTYIDTNTIYNNTT